MCERAKRRWGQIKKEGRQWKRELVWFLLINKDFLLHSISLSLYEWMMKGTIPQLSSKMSNGPPNPFSSTLLTPSEKGWNGEMRGKRYDCTLVRHFTKTKGALWQPWSITVKEVKRGRSCHVDSVGGESGQLQRLHPITPLNKSYQVLFFSYSNRTQMTEALVTLH